MIKKAVLPQHIAIIMDGNGRWAKSKGLTRIKGHIEGIKSVREITQECARKHIGQLTLYAFSYENWRRPKTEVDFLMKLLKRYLVRERKEIQKNNIRLTAIGRISELPKSVQKELAVSIEESKSNTGMILCLALNYGGRAEIIDAAKRLAEDAKKANINLEKVDEDTFRQYLYMPEMADPDLLIRTGGEMRISNFLLWEVSYTELYLTPFHWPSFRKEQLEEALKEYASRERRFGGIKG